MTMAKTISVGSTYTAYSNPQVPEEMNNNEKIAYEDTKKPFRSSSKLRNSRKFTYSSSKSISSVHTAKESWPANPNEEEPSVTDGFYNESDNNINDKSDNFELIPCLADSQSSDSYPCYPWPVGKISTSERLLSPDNDILGGVGFKTEKEFKQLLEKKFKPPPRTKQSSSSTGAPAKPVEEKNITLPRNASYSGEWLDTAEKSGEIKVRGPSYKRKFLRSGDKLDANPPLFGVLDADIFTTADEKLKAFSYCEWQGNLIKKYCEESLEKSSSKKTPTSNENYCSTAASSTATSLGDDNDNNEIKSKNDLSSVDSKIQQSDEKANNNNFNDAFFLVIHGRFGKTSLIIISVLKPNIEKKRLKLLNKWLQFDEKEMTDRLKMQLRFIKGHNGNSNSMLPQKPVLTGRYSHVHVYKNLEKNSRKFANSDTYMPRFVEICLEPTDISGVIPFGSMLVKKGPVEFVHEIPDVHFPKIIVGPRGREVIWDIPLLLEKRSEDSEKEEVLVRGLIANLDVNYPRMTGCEVFPGVETI